MTKKCTGCGAELQTSDSLKIGYIDSAVYDKSSVCERCFRIKNYNEYKTVIKENNELIDMLKDINQTNDLVVLVIDVFNLPKDLNIIKENINNNLLIVLTKRDLLPRSVSDMKLLQYINNYNINYIDKLIISSEKNYNFDALYEFIIQHKTSPNVYIVGYTNAGKSSMINKFIYNYSDTNQTITTSALPSTTINNINVKINDELTIIDTPGIINEGSIINYVDFKTLKEVLPKKEVKPKTYQIKSWQSILIDNLLRIDIDSPNDITLYFANNLKIKREYNDEPTALKKHIVNVKEDNDIVITDLGFIKVKNQAKISVYTLDDVEIFTRKSLI